MHRLIAFRATSTVNSFLYGMTTGRRFHFLSCDLPASPIERGKTGPPDSSSTSTEVSLTE